MKLEETAKYLKRGETWAEQQRIMVVQREAYANSSDMNELGDILLGNLESNMIKTWWRLSGKMIMKVRYPHLHLVDWPFRIVPDESFYSFMADRTQLVSDIKTLLRNLSRRPSSSMHLMWAWFELVRHILFIT